MNMMGMVMEKWETQSIITLMLTFGILLFVFAHLRGILWSITKKNDTWSVITTRIMSSLYRRFHRDDGILEKISVEIPAVLFQFVRSRSAESEETEYSRGHFLYVSDACQHVCGLDSTEMMREASVLFDSIHSDDLPNVYQRIAASASTLLSWQQEFRIVDSSSGWGYRWIRVHATPKCIRNSGRRLVPPPGHHDQGFCTYTWNGLFTDITAKRKEEDLLRQANSQFALAKESMNMGVWEMDTMTGYMEYDDDTLKIFDVTREELQSKANPHCHEEGGDAMDMWSQYDLWLGRCHPEDLPYVRKKLSSARLSTDRRSLEILFRVVRRNGDIRWVKVTGTKVKGQDGKTIRLTGLCFDTTETVEAQKALALSQENSELEGTSGANTATGTISSKAMFLASVSHEIRTPMNGVLGMLCLLIESDLHRSQPQQDGLLALVIPVWC